ncbi:hypothetical protein [Saccharothrix sp. ST-888]|uniref:hypothetical protein n=1 Tax=Saccharothrix sp. ST-888 TaxID=1427391 RepID=UPI0005ECC82C|nr:hypothetical protein [Saccharothrix sp. ST-888]
MTAGFAALLAVVLLSSAVPSAAAAAPAVGEASAPASSKRVSLAEARVDTFFKQYRSAVLGRNAQQARQVRAQYLSADLNRRLDAWAAAHDADPVFRAQNVPQSWFVRYGGSGAGSSTVVLTESWGGGNSRDVWYAVRLSDVLITDLADPSGPAD